MPMLEPNWEQERPSFADVQMMWRELQITHEPFSHSALDKLLHHLRAIHANGGAEFAQFKLSEHPTLHWFCSRNRLEEINFFDRFLSSPRVSSALPALKIGASGISGADFEWGNSLTLDGEIAQVLVQGGAYEKFAGPAHEAKEIARRFCEAVFGDRFAEVQIYKSYKPWSGWFYDVAWDGTWLGFDKRLVKVWLICVTDTD
jgi:hypothetical protein